MSADILSAEKFFKALFDGLEGFIEFRLIANDGRKTQTFVPICEVIGDPQGDIPSKWPEIKAKLDIANRAGANIYFGVNPRTEKVGDSEHVKTCRTLWADLDYKDAEIIKKNIAPLKAFNIEPSYVVDSGHGYHLYWLLKEPMNPAEAEVVMRNLARVLGGDSTFDAPRILRVPDTLNVKYPPHVPCNIKGAFPVRQYSPLDFDYLATVAAGIPPTKKTAAAPVRVLQYDDAVPPGMNPGSNGHPFAYAMARAIAPYWRDGIRHKMALAVAAMLRREDVSEADATLIVRKVTEFANDLEPQDRLASVRSTYAEPHIEKLASSSLIMQLLGEMSKQFFDAFNKVAATIPPPPIGRTKFPEFNLYKNTPPGSMFDVFVQYAAKQTDAPLQYHLAAIITVAAAALGNRIKLRFHGKSLFPTLYTLIVGPSSRFRKSTSISIAKAIAKAAKIPAYPNNSTVEQLYSRMAPNACDWVNKKTGCPCASGDKDARAIAWEGKPSGIIYHPEFENFLTASMKSYMADSRALYTDFYDGMVDRDSGSKETKTQGRYYIEDPAVSLLCGVTPASMRNFITKTDVGNGFLSRFLVVLPPQNHDNVSGISDEDIADLDLFKVVADKMEYLGLISGTLKLSPAANKLFAAFEDSITARIRKVEGTPQAQLDPFYARVCGMAVKVAMVYHAASDFPATEISEASMQYAVNFCGWCADILEPFFDMVRPDDGNREVRYKSQVLEIARGLTQKQNGCGPSPIPHRTLLQHSNLDAEQFRRAIDTMVEEGRIVRGKSSNGRGMIYTLNEVTR
jgi:hypothetical protein